MRKLSDTKLVVSDDIIYTKIIVYNYRGFKIAKRIKGNLLTLEGERILRMEIDKLREELDCAE